MQLNAWMISRNIRKISVYDTFCIGIVYNTHYAVLQIIEGKEVEAYKEIF